MNNTLTLTDHEICVLQTSLHMSIQSFQNYIIRCGEDRLDSVSKQTFNDMKELWERFNKEYF